MLAGDSDNRAKATEQVQLSVSTVVELKFAAISGEGKSTACRRTVLHCAD